VTTERLDGDARGSGVALVTGAGCGIGRAIAERLAADGRRVAVAARTTSEIEEVALAIDGHAIRLDVTDAAAVRAAVDEVEQTLGPLELLVANAGLAGPVAPFWQQEPDDWWRVVDVNLRGPFLCAHAVLPHMVERGAGRIVAVASNAAFIPLGDGFLPPISAYAASKAALVRFVEAIAAEAGAHGVRAFAISPGMVRTTMTEGLFESVPDDAWSPPELTAALVARIAEGSLDALSGRYLHARNDDWETLPSRAAEIAERDLLMLRLRRAGE
jgi:NAD(P)-dependent dehydrogenase (short-subunit alcohol dehydrogenase family)